MTLMKSVRNGVALSVLVSAALGSVSASAQTKREPSYTVSLNQDSFFGFYPQFTGMSPISDTVDFTFYGTLWTRPSFGLNPTNSGDDLWTEFGIGVNLNLMGGKLKVKPQLGLTNGSLLSGGARGPGGTVEGSNFADGIVPSLTVNYSDTRFEAEWYSGYYAALSERGSDASLDFLHLWANAGVKLSSLVSVGGHYELLENTRNTYPGGATGNTYEWLGGYVQFTLPKGFYARFTAGADISDNRGDFYKLGVGMTF